MDGKEELVAPDIPAEPLNKPRVDDVHWGITFNDEPNYPAPPCNLPIQTWEVSFSVTITIMKNVRVITTPVGDSFVTDLVIEYETLTFNFSTTYFFDPCTFRSGTSNSNSIDSMSHFERRGGNIPPPDVYKEIMIPPKPGNQDAPLIKEEMAFTAPLVITVFNANSAPTYVSGFKAANPGEITTATFKNHGSSQHLEWFVPQDEVEIKVVIPQFYMGVWRDQYRLFIYTDVEFLRYLKSKENSASDQILKPDTYTFQRRAK